MKIKLALTGLAILDGAIVPRGYAFGYHDWTADVRFYYLLPIGFVVRAWRRLVRWYWRVAHGQEDPFILAMMVSAKSIAEKDGYKKGYDAGRHQVYREKRFEALINSLLPNR